MTSRSALPTLLATPLLALGTWLVEPQPAQAEADDPYSGTYDMRGMTTDLASGDQRRIEGHVVLAKKGEGWSASSELTTQYPTAGGPVHTEVIGSGAGVAVGEGLEGTAHTQLVIGTVPGLHSGFQLVPRQVGPRIVSKWKARLEKDGTLVVELSNQPEPGETYSPTKTTLRGKRVSMPAEAATDRVAPVSDRRRAPGAAR